MTPFLKPMLASSLMPPGIEHTDELILKEMKKLTFPVIATLKLDGIRALKTTDLVSRTFKMIPNESIRCRAMKFRPGFDMELYATGLSYDEVESIVMSEEHERSDEIQFHLLDIYSMTNTGYYGRVMKMLEWEGRSGWEDVVFPAMEYIYTPEDLLTFFLKCEKEEGEGICFRRPDSEYKQGRSTLKEQFLVKLARYVRSEVRIVAFEEQFHNTNAQKRNAVDKMDRSKCAGGMVGKGTLGAFICMTEDGKPVRVGTGVGLTDVVRQQVWDNRPAWHGKYITIKSKPHGTKVAPRSPIYVGRREEGF